MSSIKNLWSKHGLKVDYINNPPHYNNGGVETIEFIEGRLSSEEYRGYLLGTIVKYISRAGKKDSFLDDIKKARWYLDRLIFETENKEKNKHG